MLEFLDCLLSPIKREISWLRKGFSYALFLRKDYDWDYAYLYALMRFKLERMAKCIETNQIGMNYKRIAKQIRYACWLLNELEKGDSEQCPGEYLKFTQSGVREISVQVDFALTLLRQRKMKNKARKSFLN